MNLLKKINKNSIQFISDLHIPIIQKKFHIPDYIILPQTKYLALLGDIGNPSSDIYDHFLSEITPKFEKVFLIAGNHEFYNNNISSTKNKLIDFTKKYNNLIFLDNNTYDLGKYKIIGSTLWSNINNIAIKANNDYNAIYNDDNKLITPNNTLKWHKESIKFITHEINNTNKPIILLTHHAPHIEMCGIYKGKENNSAYYTDLSHLLKHPVKYWLNGHTHQNLTYKTNDVIIRSNCYGYEYQRQHYSNIAHIVLD